MASLAVGSARLGGGFDSPSLEGARTPPVSKYNPHYHARDDFYVVQHKQSPPQSTTPVSRPRTASSSDKKLIEQPASALAYKNSLDNHWNSALPDTPQSQTTFRSYRTDVGTIGVALGSPRDNPLPRIPREIHAVRPKIDVTASPTYSWAPIVPDGANKGEDALKSKGRWKVFGGIFTRKEPSTPDSTLSSFDSKRSSPPSFSRTSASSRPQITVTQTKETTYEQQPSNTVKAIARENTKRNVLSKKPKSENLKPAMHRAQTVPTASRSPRRSPSPSGRNLSARAAVQRSQSDNKPSLLQLNLPDVSMERYSVMFSDVLKPTQPSLMQRRQAQLKELKTIGEVETMPTDTGSDTCFTVPIRPATSPSPRSPSFSLFPPPTKTPKRIPSPLSLAKAATLQRSATAPPGSVSPAQAAFNQAEINKPSIVHVPFKTEAPQSSNASSCIEQEKWNSDSSYSTQPSPIDDSDVDRRKGFPMPQKSQAVFRTDALGITEIKIDHHGTDYMIPEAPIVPVLPWSQSCTPAVGRSRSATFDSGKPSTSTPATHIPTTVPPTAPRPQTHVRQPSFTLPASQPQTIIIPPTRLPSSSLPLNTSISHGPTPTPASTNPLSSSPPSEAEISIARQISVSRRQKQLLIPIPKTVRQPMRPVYVDVANEIEAGVVAVSGQVKKGGMGHVSRKSHHVLVETV